MASIRGRLTQAFLTGIGAMALVVVLFVGVHLYVANLYGAVTDRVFAQYQVTTLSDETVRLYNEYRNRGTADSLRAYEESAGALAGALAAAAPQSVGDIQERALYDGLENATQDILDTMAQGIRAYQDGDVAVAAERYSDAAREQGLVRESASALILHELTIAEALDQRADRTQEAATIAGAVVMAAVLAISVAQAVEQSRRIADPLVRLSDVASRVAAGSTDIEMDPSLLQMHDETGTLATAFDTMLKNLRATITRLEQTRQHLSEQNATLEKLNNLFIQRESRIAELREEVASLKGEKKADADHGTMDAG